MAQMIAASEEVPVEHEKAAPKIGTAVTVKLVTCVDGPGRHGHLSRLRDVLPPHVAASVLVLREENGDDLPGTEVIQVWPGTKLSKLREAARLAVASSRGHVLFCVCDPDMVLDEARAGKLVQRALRLAEDEPFRPVIVYGRVKSAAGSTLLHDLISFDKDWSHCVIRPLLWWSGVGVSVPGQFLVVSASLFAAMDQAVDSYLDDLYLGVLARSVPGTRVIAESVVIGAEHPRQDWPGLLAQRLRWMRGFFALVWHLKSSPAAVARLGAHFFAYHAFPLLALVLLVGLCLASPTAGLLATSAFAVVTSLVVGGNPTVGLIYWLAYPVVHLIAILGWWLPLPVSFLRRR